MGTALAEMLLNCIRRYQYHRGRSGVTSLLLRRLARAERNVLSIITGSDIAVETQIGRNLRLPHPNGVVMHRAAVVGDDCMIMQQVTLGQLACGGAPVVGAGVYIGAGAKVLGPVRVGDGAKIGANAVVLDDVPASATAVGIPARVIEAPSAGLATNDPHVPPPADSSSADRDGAELGAIL